MCSYACANDHGFKVMEVNSSQRRSGRDLKLLFGEAVVRSFGLFAVSILLIIFFSCFSCDFLPLNSTQVSDRVDKHLRRGEVPLPANPSADDDSSASVASTG